jgi:hypothetical protein
LRAEGPLHRAFVSPEGIAGKLATIGEAGGKVFDEAIRHVLRAIPNGESWNQLRFGIQSDPSPNVTGHLAIDVDLLLIRILLLHSNEAPNLIDLDKLAGEIPQFFVHDALAPFAHADAKAHDGIAVNARHPFDASDAAAFAEHGDRHRLFIVAELVSHIVSFVVDFMFNRKYDERKKFLLNINENRKTQIVGNGEEGANCGRAPSFGRARFA